MIDVTLSSNGRYWQALWTDSEGRRRARSLGPKAKISRRQAERQCRQLAAEMIHLPSMRDAGRAPTLPEWIGEFLATETALGDLTRDEYKTTGDYLCRYFGGRRIDQITPRACAAFRAWLSEQPARGKRTMSEQTVRKHMRHAKRLFGRAAELELIARNPFTGQKSSVARVDKSWRYVTLDELDRLLGAAPSPAWQCLIALCRLAGLRLGEALRLQWEDINWTQPATLTVQHQGETTTKRRTRIVPIQPKLYTLLLRAFEQAEPGSQLVAPVGRNNLRRQLDAIAKRSGLSPWPKLYHTLRKNCETDWLARYPVMDVCDWLGHAPTVAARHYHQTRPETLARAAGAQGEVEQLHDQIQRLRRRLRRVISIARQKVLTP